MSGRSAGRSPEMCVIRCPERSAGETSGVIISYRSHSPPQKRAETRSRAEVWEGATTDLQSDSERGLRAETQAGERMTISAELGEFWRLICPLGVWPGGKAAVPRHPPRGLWPGPRGLLHHRGEAAVLARLQPHLLLPGLPAAGGARQLRGPSRSCPGQLRLAGGCSAGLDWASFQVAIIPHTTVSLSASQERHFIFQLLKEARDLDPPNQASLAMTNANNLLPCRDRRGQTE